MNTKIQFNETPQMKLIRSAEESKEDAEKLADCLNTWSEDDSWGGSFGSSEWTAEKVFKDWLENSKLVDQLLLVENNVVQAYGSLDGHWHDEDTVYIPLLGARPKEQGKGYGKALLLKILQKSIELGKRRLDLGTWAGNTRAVPLYKKTGFFWAVNTSVYMENYLPAVLGTKYFEDFFAHNDFYSSRILEITQKHDDFKYNGIQAYHYHFVQDDENSIKIYVDHWIKELSGFVHRVGGKELSVQFIPRKQEVYLGLDQAEIELVVSNQLDKQIHITGKLLPFKNVELDTQKLDLTLEPGATKSLVIKGDISFKAKTLVPEEHSYSRSEVRFVAELEIDGKACQLGSGWIAKDAISLVMQQRSVHFGKYSNEEKLVIPYRNLTSKHLEGNIKINGEGIDEIQDLFVLEPYQYRDLEIRVPRPKGRISQAWPWNFVFEIKEENAVKPLPEIKRHIAGFTTSGVVAYENPRERAVIENDQYRFEFQTENEGGLIRMTSNTHDFSHPLYIRNIQIGLPFPDDQSEFWGNMEKPYEIVEKDGYPALKQTFHSKVEKPGLEITRWMEMEPGKPYLHMYFEMKNTNKDKIIEQVAVKSGGWVRNDQGLFGRTIIPEQEGIIVANDREFSDSLDYPHKPTDFAEPWIAREPYGGIGEGWGIIWQPDQIKEVRISPFSHPSVVGKAYDLQPEEIRKMGQVTYVFGQPAAQKTREIWLREFAGKTSPITDKEIVHGKQLLEVRVGEPMKLPHLDQPVPTFTMLNTGQNTLPLAIEYRARRETPVELSLGISSSALGLDHKQDFSLKEHEQTNIEYETVPNHVVPIHTTVKMPYSLRSKYSLVVPYKTGEITLEKEEGYWKFGNGIFEFKTSPTHAASLFSASFKGGELLFSRYPDKGPFSWFKNFVGGISPEVILAGAYRDFPTNNWSNPKLVKNQDWTGLCYHLDNPTSSKRLREFVISITYYTRPYSPVLWSVLEVKNNSLSTADVNLSIDMVFKPIDNLYVDNGQFEQRTHTERSRQYMTNPLHNWSIIEMGEKAILLTNPDPTANFGGSYMNASGYSSHFNGNWYKIHPGETKYLHVGMIMAGNIKDLQKAMSRDNDPVKIQ